MQVVPRVAIERMRHQDIPTVQAIEREIFLSPWPRNAYATELAQNRQASYVVLREDGDLVGYAGLWKVVHEAHVTTIGVRSRDQGKGYGKTLFAALILRSYELGARWMTLEPGDVILTGTPHGVGFAMNPPRCIGPGDIVECEVAGLGRLRNEVVA